MGKVRARDGQAQASRPREAAREVPGEVRVRGVLALRVRRRFGSVVWVAVVAVANLAAGAAKKAGQGIVDAAKLAALGAATLAVAGKVLDLY